MSSQRADVLTYTSPFSHLPDLSHGDQSSGKWCCGWCRAGDGNMVTPGQWLVLTAIIAVDEPACGGWHTVKDIAQGLKMLHSSWDLGSNPRTHIKMGTAAHICNPRELMLPWKKETRTPQSCTASPAHTVVSRACFKQGRRSGLIPKVVL